MSTEPASRLCPSSCHSRREPASRLCLSCCHSRREPAFRLCLSCCHFRRETAFRRPRRRTQTLASVALIATTLLAGCHHLPPPTPLDQLNLQQQAGYEVFQTRCAVCHYERVNEPKQGPSLVSLYKKPYLPSGAPANDDRITNTILHGHGLMPAQPNLDPDALNALLAYLKTV